MRPLILITNDDGIVAKGLHVLCLEAVKFGDVVVMAPETNSSGKSHSLTTDRPLRVRTINSSQWLSSHYSSTCPPLTNNDASLSVYACEGTPVDCVKLAVEHFCPRQPDLVLSGINHGSNSSINILYSGTMGAVVEASALGINSIGFSLLNHNPEADFSSTTPYIHKIIETILLHPLPLGTSLNVNIPRTDKTGPIKGIHICHQAKAKWVDSYQERTDPQGRPYWWLTGKFLCEDAPEASDEYALSAGYISIVPIQSDFTDYSAINSLKQLFPI